MTTYTNTADNATIEGLAGLRDTLITSECNKHAQVQMLVAACIDEGINRGPKIIETLVMLGFDKKHVGMQLANNLDHLWKRDGERYYKALPPLADNTDDAPAAQPTTTWPDFEF